MIKIITNTDVNNAHQHLLKQLFGQANLIYIATAFLKKAAVDMLTSYLNGVPDCKVIAGYNFGITDPDALTKIMKLSERMPNVQGYLNNMKLKEVFHPKLYLIRDAEYCHIITGSANMTNGGLLKNNEVSIYHRCLEADEIWQETLAYFNECIHPDKADLLSARIIAIYREYHKKQKQIAKQVKEFPDVTNSLFYDLKQLKQHLLQLDRTELEAGFQQKRLDYREAKEILDILAERQHAANDFRNMLEDLAGKAGMPGLWYSNGLFRHKTKLFKQQASFRKLILAVRNNLGRSPQFIYDQAKKAADAINGAGPNFIGEIMMTYAPDKLANINQNPITVLRREGNVDIKAASSSYNGKDYEEYNEIIHEIARGIGLKDMLEIDYFFNKIYQKIKNG